MSYFSHHPEAWDEIERKGIVKKLVSYAGFDIPETEENASSFFENLLSNMQLDHDPPIRQIYEMLRVWATEEIEGAEQEYWESLYRKGGSL